MTETFDVNDLITGCVLDGANRGHYISADIILEAASLGWDGGDRDADGRNAIDVANDYRDGADGPEVEFIGEDADEAEEWLNDNRAAEGHRWGMWEGSFYYEDQEWWNEFDY